MGAAPGVTEEAMRPVAVEATEGARTAAVEATIAATMTVEGELTTRK